MLFEAIKNNRADIVSAFLNAGGSVDAIIESPRYPFHGFNALLLSVVVGNDDIVRLLLDHGAEAVVQPH